MEKKLEFTARVTRSVFQNIHQSLCLLGKIKKISLLMHLGIYSWKLPLFKNVLTVLTAIAHNTAYLEATNI